MNYSTAINKRKISGRKRNQIIFSVVMLAIPVLQFLVFYVGVNFNSIIMAFQRYDAQTNSTSFVGFDNFARLFAEFKLPELKNAFKNSFLLYAVNLFIKMPLALLFSYYIAKKLFMFKFFRVILFLPMIISSVVFVVIFRYFIDGAIPSLYLQLTGEEMYGWIGTPETATRMTTLIFYSVWSSFGTIILVFSGAMSGISESIVESAKIDGVGFFGEMFHITIPMIFPSVITFLMNGLALLFVDQMNLYSFYTGEADPETVTVGYWLYRATVRAGNDMNAYNYLASFGIFLTLVCAPAVFFVRWTLRRFGPSAD